MTNYDSVIAQLTGAGLILDGGIQIGRMQRVKTEDDRRERRGWYSLHEITGNQGDRMIVGSFGVWQGADNNAQKIALEKGTLSTEQADVLKKRIADDRRRADADRKQAATLAAQEAARVWRQYIPEGQSDYLTKKGVKAYGLRYSPSGNGTCAVPMTDTAGKVWGLQILRGKDRREGKLPKEYFPRGLAKQGHFHLIGLIRDLVLVCEGYATGASLHEATEIATAVAFDAGNLRPVAEAIKKAHPRARILICADDDYLTAGNPGVTAAEVAALAVNGRVVKPVFTVDRAGQKITDFNDLATLEGLPAVRAQVQAVVGIGGPTTSLARGSIPEGGGEGDQAMPARVSIDEAVARFWGTYGLGGDVLFDEVERRLVHKKDVVNLLPRHGWDTLRDHYDWRVARDTEIGFDPTEKDPAIRCNLFGGWPTVPVEGTCTKLLELLEYLCANETNDREVYEWILKWLAYPIQHRGAKMHSTIVLHGPQGTGKSRFFEAYGQIFGPYSRVLGQEALEDKFNADWAEKKLFILADEVLARADMYHLKNRLKGFITGDTIRVNPKNVAAHNEKNQMNIVFLSNERQPLVLENDDRRHLVIWAPPKLPDTFFAEVNTEIDNGGVAALHHYLLGLDLGEFKPWTRPPMTKAKGDLVELSASSEDRFIKEWLAGQLEGPQGDPLPVCPCLGSHLFTEYSRWCEGHGERRRGSKDLISLVSKQPGWRAGESVGTLDTLGGSTVKNRKMVIPPEFVVTGDHARDRYTSQAEWLAVGFFAFATAAGLNA